MNKHFSIEQLDKKPPFKVPEGYFESLTSRVMAQIPDVSADAGKAEKTVMKPKTKVVGLMPHKTKRPWVKWAVAAAACLCGVGFFLSQQSSDEGKDQLASQKPAVITMCRRTAAVRPMLQLPHAAARTKVLLTPHRRWYRP